MSKRLKYLKIISLSLIFLWFLRPLIFTLFYIDFPDSETRSIFKVINSFAVTISVGALIHISSTKTNKKSLSTIIIACSFSFLFIVGVNKLSNFCFPTYSKTIYKNINNSSTIKERIFNCGAGDSDSPYGLVVTNKFLFFLIKFEPIKKVDIDSRVWQKLNND